MASLFSSSPHAGFNDKIAVEESKVSEGRLQRRY
jgi:hypothetical protein